MMPPSSSPPPRITLRALLLGALTIVAVFHYLILEVGQGSGSGSYVLSQFPMAAFGPFVVWLFVNVGLKCLWPRAALRQDELLVIFSMLWVVGALPQWGWSDYWIAIAAAPAYLKSPENQFAELFFAFLPWHLLPAATPRVIDPFWMGLTQGGAVPWDAWWSPFCSWFLASLAIVVFGFCLVVLFQRHWEESERLGFPLAQLPLELTRGWDGDRRVPDLFRSGVFWIGFAVVFLPLLYNIAAYFSPGLPLIEVYAKRYAVSLPRPLPDLTFRILPFVLALTYLCPLDILGSLVAFVLLAVAKIGVCERVGFAGVGRGQTLDTGQILSLESFGAIAFIAGWSVWLARGHLRGVWTLVRTGAGDRGQVRRYRLAVAGLLASGAWVIAFACDLGASLPVAAGSFAMMAMTSFVTIKLIAATGFPYLMTSWPNVKGQILVADLVGTEHLSTQSLVAFKLFTSSAFFGNIRLPAWPALPHHLRLFPLRQQPVRVVVAVLLAFVVGSAAAVWASLEMAYAKGGANFLVGATHVYDDLAHLLQNPTAGDPAKWAIWFVGLFEAAGLALLRARCHWFPLHPVGLAFQYTSGTSIYWFSLFLVWITKLTLLRYGGVRAYQGGKPFFFGLGIGYVVAVVLSGVVDLVWFPLQGHPVHQW